MKKLEGKIAVITGGSSGIGLATAKRFVEEGAHVVITGRREKELKEAAAFIMKNVTTVVGDVSLLEDLDRLYAVVKEKHGHIDILFANAGAGTIAPLAVATEAHFDQTFDVNVKGLFFTVQKALPLFKDGGSIILNSSVSNVLGLRLIRIRPYMVAGGSCSWQATMTLPQHRLGSLRKISVSRRSSLAGCRKVACWSRRAETAGVI